MRMGIAGEESFQPQDVAIDRTPYDHRSADTLLEQHHTTQYQRTHDQVTQVRLLHQHVTQLLRRKNERLNWVLSLRIDQRWPPGELRQLAREGTGPVSDDRAASRRAIMLRDSHVTGNDNEHPKPDLTGAGEVLTFCKRAHLAEAHQATDLRPTQCGKPLSVTCIYDRWSVQSAPDSC